MAHSTVFVGLDYHQTRVQVCVLEANGKVLINRNCRNSASKIASIVANAGPAQEVQVAVEASTGSADLADELMARFGWQVHLAHARYVAKLKQSPDKTDFSDARLLADLLRVGYLPRTWLPPQHVRDLRRLVGHRQNLANQRRAAKQRVQAIRREHRITDAPANAWTKAWIGWLREHPDLTEASRWLIEEYLAELAWLNQRIVRVERELAWRTADDPLVQQLLAEPGIGEVTAWTLRASVGRFERFHSAKALCRYCGLSPRNVSSGSRQADGGVIEAADPHLRAVLIQVAKLLPARVQRWNDLRQSLKKRGKTNNVISVAIANRWMRELYHRMKHVPATPAATTPAQAGAKQEPAGASGGAKAPAAGHAEAPSSIATVLV